MNYFKGADRNVLTEVKLVFVLSFFYSFVFRKESQIVLLFLRLRKVLLETVDLCLR